MKTIGSLLVGLALLGIGVFLGYSVGNNKGYDRGIQEAKNQLSIRSIDEIKNELRIREAAVIKNYLKASAALEKKDEGGLFTVKYVNYISGSVSNSAAIATAKDMKLKVNYLSGNTEVGSQEITLSEYVKAGQITTFRQQVNVPEKVDAFSVQVLTANSD